MKFLSFRATRLALDFPHQKMQAIRRARIPAMIMGRRGYATPDTPLRPVGVQLWEEQQTGQSTAPKEEKDDFYTHPLYTPIPKVETG